MTGPKAYNAMMQTVRLLREDGVQATYHIPGSAIIGRHSACDIRIKDAMASRRHAEVYIRDEQVFIHDLGAANPARVNGMAISEEQRLDHGDVIGIGAVRLRVSIDFDQGTSSSASARAEQAPNAAHGDDTSLANDSDEDEAENNRRLYPCLLYGGATIVIRDSMILGRQRDCAVQITDQRASRQHLEVGLDEHGLPWIRDLETVNGTRLNGRRLGPERTTLSHGDRISVGASHLMVHLPQAKHADGQPRNEDHGEPAQSQPEPSGTREAMAELIGREIAGYRLGALLGEGSLAAVFKATQISLRREVAIKVFRPSVLRANADFGSRLLEAARISGRVEHDNISRIHECGREADGLLWYSMELVDGESLAKLIERDGPLSPEAALVVLERIARALEAAHATQVCHWDIQPPSVLINENGTVKVLDLGLGQVLQEGYQSSQQSMVVGNPAYMSPERCRGEPGDHRSDMYGMGCLFHFLVTGNPPYQQRNPMALLKAQQQAPLPSLLELGLPSCLDALLAGLMAKNPEWRFDDYAELLLEIQQTKNQLGIGGAAPQTAPSVGNGSKPGASPATRERPVLRRRSRSNGTLVNVVIAGLLIIGLIVFFPSFLELVNGLANRPEQPVQTNPQSSQNAGTNAGTTETRQITNAANGSDPNTGSGGDTGWFARWQSVREQSEQAIASAQWANAEFQVTRFMATLPQEEGAVREIAESRLLSIRAQGSEWYQSHTTQLSDDLRQRLETLQRWRNQVLSRHQGDVEARYQSTISQANGYLLSARREAIALLEQGQTAALPALAQATSDRLAGTPIESLAQQFVALCQEASRLAVPSNWTTVRQQLIADLENETLEGETGLSAAAALILDGAVPPARNYLMGATDLAQGPLRLRRERLLRADTLILTFESPVDLAFVAVEYGQVILDEGLRGGQTPHEPVGISCTTPLRGQQWEAGLHLQLPQRSEHESATVSITENNRPIALLRFDDQGVTFIGRNSNGETEQNDPSDLGSQIRVRMAAHQGELAIFINDQPMLMGWQLPDIGEATLRLDADSPGWALSQLHLLEAQ